jgi:hypothetical protein
MSSSLIYRALVPDAPSHRRTEGDEFRDSLFALRSRSNGFLLEKAIVPGLQEPALVSSFNGAIERILFCFPSWAAEDSSFVQAYQSVISALRIGTKFVVVHHASIKPRVEQWFATAGHKPGDVLLVGLADYVSLTDWAEDAYVSLKDVADGSEYLMEPWEFKRAGDALIADAVEEFSDIKATQAPLVFQGGNCLIGSDFWMLGKDYFVDTLELLQGQRPPVAMPDGVSPEAFARELFTKYVDSSRKLLLIGSKKPIPIREYIGTKVGADYYLEVAGGGVGTFQPIFHIDMFISLVGTNSLGKFELLVGSPALADKMLGTRSPFALDDVYDSIAKSLTDLGFAVRRNPLVHRPTIGKSFTISKLKEIIAQPGFEALAIAVKELTTVGATDTTVVQIRDWHHITWNNCLVENSASKGKHVYLPTFGHTSNADLKPIDSEMKAIWEALGFTVHMLGDFNKFAERQGVVHCIKKYLSRGS